MRTRSESFFQGVLSDRFWRAYVECRGASFTIALHIDVFIVQPRLIGRSLQRCQSHAFCLARAIALRGQFQRALFDVFSELLRLNDAINQPPLLRSLTATTIRNGAQPFCAVAALHA